MNIDIKQLQKDFTTIEQSKQLLDLEVPPDSANMAYQALNGKCYSNDMCGWRVNPSVLYIAKPDWSKHEWYPCWSTGRLIEIYEICTGETFERNDVYDIFSDIFTTIKSALLNHKMDFSKLKNII